MKVTIIAVAAAFLLSAGSVRAQDPRPLPVSEQSKYIVSARAGVVSFVEGRIYVQGVKPFSLPERLAVGSYLEMDDVVRTDPNGRVEILLNPGSYLRLAPNTEFVFQFDGMDRNQIKLLRGSAVLEASAVDEPILVYTPRASITIARGGLYRFNVDADGRSEVAVYKGRASVGNVTIKGGKRASVAGDTAVLARFDKRDGDDLDDWSKVRAKTLIAANRQLSDTLMRRSLGMSFATNAWIFDPFCRCYTFLPFSSGFASPYGWRYSVCNPYWYTSPANSRWNGGGSYAGNPGNGSGSGSSGGGSRGGAPGGGGGTPGNGSSGRGGSVGGGNSSRAPATNPPSRSAGSTREIMPRKP